MEDQRRDFLLGARIDLSIFMCYSGKNLGEVGAERFSFCFVIVKT